MACYLGVDGGGSKTAFALIDDRGRVLARTTAPTSYYFNDGFDVVERVLAQGISEICAQVGGTPADIDAAFFGIPGYGEASADIARLDAVPAGVLGHGRYRCDNDMVCGWAGSLACADGINVISGTGSMTYGERQGVGHRVGGWGELFGDEGSAYWVAAQGLNAFTRMSDGRLTRGALHEMLKERLELASDLDVVSLIIEKWSGNRSKIAALATTVCDAARDGDPAATKILSTAVDELVDLVEATARLVGFTGHETVPVSYSGGMFSGAEFLQMFAAALDARPTKYDLKRPMFDPALGAALYAAKVSGSPLGPDALHQLSSSTH